MSNCVTLPNFVAIGQMSSRYLDFGFFKMAIATILDFLKFHIFTFLTIGTVREDELRQHAKLRQNLSNRGRDMAIFPPYWICNACVGTTHEEHLVVFITVQNLVGIDAVVLIKCTLFRFREFGLKTLIHASKLGFLGF